MYVCDACNCVCVCAYVCQRYLLRAKFQREREAALVLQRVVRRRRWLERRKWAARTLQRAWRQHHRRQQAQTMLLQAVFRGVLTRKQCVLFSLLFLLFSFFL